MRIALVGPYPEDSTARGGVETSFSSLVAGLSASHESTVHVITFVPGLEGPERTLVDRVPVLRLPGTRRLANVTRHLAERRALAGALEEIRPDLVHAQDALRYGYVCLRAERRAPVVVSVHGIVREERRYASGIRARAQIGLAGVALERYCVRHASFVVSPTRYAREYFGDELRGRFWDIGNPIADAFFDIDSRPETGGILYMGSIIPRKRLLDLVEALALVRERVPEAHVRVAGGGADSEYGKGVRRRVRELGLDGSVTFLGPVSPIGATEEYARAALLVLPSDQETSPMVIGEAMAAGVPVVATDVGGVRYLVQDEVTGNLVAPGDVDALTARVADVLGDPARGKAYGAAGRADADERFRTSAVAARMFEVYEAALEGATGP